MKHMYVASTPCVVGVRDLHSSLAIASVQAAQVRAGLDSAELISQLRAAHAEQDTRMGVDVVLGKAGDMAELGIYECYRVSQHPKQSCAWSCPNLQCCGRTCLSFEHCSVARSVAR